MELNDYLESKAMENPLIQLKPPKRKLTEWQDFVSDTAVSLSEVLLIQLNLKSLTDNERKCVEELIYSRIPKTADHHRQRGRLHHEGEPR